MEIPNLIDCVKGSVAIEHYQDGQLWYRCLANDFTFPVPIDDTGNGVFKNVDNAMFFMRWIRKHIEYLTAAQAEHAKC